MMSVPRPQGILLNIKQTSAIFCRNTGCFFHTYLAKGCQFFCHIADIGRFIALTAVGLGRQIRAVRFDEDTV